MNVIVLFLDMKGEDESDSGTSNSALQSPNGKETNPFLVKTHYKKINISSLVKNSKLRRERLCYCKFFRSPKFSNV